MEEGSDFVEPTFTANSDSCVGFVKPTFQFWFPGTALLNDWRIEWGGTFHQNVQAALRLVEND